jgi:hypothetical protein
VVRVAATVMVLILISMSVLTAIASRDGGRGGGMQEFNACVTGSRFLVLVRHGHGSSVVETIKDRARRAVVGEVTVNRTPPVMLRGAAADNDGYLMSTATSLGRDALTIEGCWDRPFPVA